jgi:hypothetical protein
MTKSTGKSGADAASDNASFVAMLMYFCAVRL